jgi:chromosome segregation ATPase
LPGLLNAAKSTHKSNPEEKTMNPTTENGATENGATGITDTTAQTTVASFDLEAARTAVASAKATLAEQERAIAAGELAEAEQRHAPLLEQCRTLQERFDAVNSQVEAQRHVYFQALTRKYGAQQAIDTERRNRPVPDWDGGRAYRAQTNTEWEERIRACVEEQKAADEAFGPVYAELSRLQGERRAVSKELETASWQEGDAKTLVAGLKKRLAKLTPAGSIAPRPWQESEFPDSATATFSSTNAPRF